MDEILLTAQSLVTGYRDGSHATPVAGPADLEVRAGELTVVLGANGAGKSTLLRTLGGIQPPLSGTVTIGTRDLAGLSPMERARQLSLVYTDRTLAGALTVYETVALGRQPHTGFFGRLGADDRNMVDKALSVMGIGAMCSRHMATLSDGERQKAMIARAIAQDTTVIILDEPTAFLDVASRLDTMDMLSRLARNEGKGIVVSTHDTGEALSVADKGWLIYPGGRIASGDIPTLSADGSMDSLFADRGVTYDPVAHDFRMSRRLL